MIRNIKQSHQEREIIKTAPDMVVYIENLPYVFNQWVTDDQGIPVSVNINEYITNIAVTGGVECMIPTCAITMNVPNHLRYMFQAPGGNRLLNTMDEIQVFCKGYYLSKEGRTVYHRIFHGIISSVNTSDSNGTMDISLSCDGILKLLEIMLISESPAVGNISGATSTPYIDQFGGKNPYAQIAAMFRSDLDSLGVLSQTNITQTSPDTPEYTKSLSKSQSMKWGPKLRRLAKLVRLYGMSSKELYKINKKDPFAFDKRDPQYKGNTTKEEMPESKTLNQITFGKIEEYLPSMGIGAISLLNSRVINRLEKLRTIVDGIMFEVYQDLGGEIIIKPPLYNLDVTMIHETTEDGGETILDEDLFEENNPFIIFASEVEAEHETEDQSQVRATRMTVQASWDPGLQMGGGEWARGVGVYCDVHMASKFGIRESGVKQLGFAPNCSKGLFALAISELTKANRSYRTYTCTIPVRPELRLGFPVYITHHDMYAYPRTVSINYSRGGSANMTLSCDTIRKRPTRMVKVKVTPEGQKEPIDQWVYKSSPNLVYKWSHLDQMQKTEDVDDLVGNLATRTNKPLPKEHARLKAYTSDRLGSLLETKPDTEFGSWVIQDGGKDSKSGGFNMDKPHAKIDPKNRKADKDKPTDKGVNPSTKIIADNNYIELCTTMLPYTDEKGYELAGPFPMGRWIALDKAMEDVFQDGYITPPPESKVWTRLTDSGTAFVFAGIGGFKASMVESIMSAADDLSNNSGSNWDKAQGSAQSSKSADPMVADGVEPYIRSFELTYDDPASTNGGSLEQQAKSDPTPGATVEVKPDAPGFMEKIADKVDGFLSGFHQWASKPGEGQGTNHRSTFRGRLGSLSNDIKFHPNEPSVGNSYLADRMATGFTNFLTTGSPGMKMFENKKES